MRTRFAPSPTGPLHLGHAFSALTAMNLAKENSGECLLRIEDIDQSRARDYWEQQIYSDLDWLGFGWSGPVLRQSDQLKRYSQALDRLWEQCLLYPCHCNRRDITEALSAPQEGNTIGPDGVIYPGSCRDLPRPMTRPTDVNLRLDMSRAIAAIKHLKFVETTFQNDTTRTVEVNLLTIPEKIGDIVLSRKDMETSYHLSVVVDDAMQEITDVVRGEDLFDATQIHVIVQELLGLPTPTYHHHRLIRDESGKRLAKRDDARAIRSFRDAGLVQADIYAMIGL